MQPLANRLAMQHFVNAYTQETGKGHLLDKSQQSPQQQAFSQGLTLLSLPIHSIQAHFNFPLSYVSRVGRHRLADFPQIIIQGQIKTLSPVAIVGLLLEELVFESSIPLDAASLLEKWIQSCDALHQFLVQRENDFDDLVKAGQSFIETEQALILGHSMHPAPKSRIGFVHEDWLKFSPEHKVLSQAALLHRDISGQSILSVLIQASGLSPLAWLAQFGQVYLSPLLLCLYRYGLAFSPHGENTMLVHENGMPKALVLKDFIDDINLVDEDFPELAQLPSEGGLLLRHEATDLSHLIFTGLFMVDYRYICNVFLQDYPEYSEFDFWQTISNTIVAFNQQHPELAERPEKFTMLRPTYTKICLNRVRLFTTSYNDEAERPVPVFLDPIANPVSPETLAEWSVQQAEYKAG